MKYKIPCNRSLTGGAGQSSTMNASAYQQISKSANRLVRPFFAVSLVLMIVAAMLSKGIYDVGDGITHYQIARWSWKHPELFLHHWGKPVFTFIASLPAQFGYKGLVLFNVLCHIGTAWLTWRIADRMKMPFAFLAGPLVIFAPVSWGVAQSGLTEPLFALTLMLGIYFVTGGRYNIAAVIISLLPFVRTEGFLLAPLFGIYFLVRKEFKPLFLLLSGTVFYSVLGGIFVLHDFLWVIHGNPYKGEPLYGHGNLFHFIAQNEFIFGWAITGLLALGLITAPFRKKFTPVHSMVEIILVYGCFTVFFVAHSVFWWKGLFGSLGLLRVMVCVMPCAVIMSLRGMQLITLPFRNRKFPVAAVLIIACGLTAFNSINHHTLFLRPDQPQLDAEEVAAFMKEKGLEKRLLLYSHPLTPFLLDKDPFDPWQCLRLEKSGWPDKSVIVWDSHFGAGQNGVEEKDLLDTSLDKWLQVPAQVPQEYTPARWRVYVVNTAVY